MDPTRFSHAPYPLAPDSQSACGRTDRMMERRTVMAVLVSGLLAAPLAAQAQQAGSPVRIGFLPLGSPSSTYDQSLVEAFRQGLREVGVVENRHVVLDIVWSSSEPEISQSVSDLIQRGVKLLIPCGSNASAAAMRQTTTIPILFINVGNPVGIGLVKSLSHPGQNATGFSDMLAELSGKYVELARELGKRQASVDYLWHTGWPDGQYRFQATEQAAQSLGVKLRSRGIGDIAEVNDAMAAMKKAGAVTLIIQPSPFTFRQRHLLIESARKHGLATIFPFPAAASDGAMIAYGPDLVDMYQRVGSYVDRILKGAKPADLPVQQPTKFDLVINLKTAKALGLTIPQSLLGRADEVIQ
jgi:putative tryptophan/tyrosine transport system substrate-binding protein